MRSATQWRSSCRGRVACQARQWVASRFHDPQNVVIAVAGNDQCRSCNRATEIDRRAGTGVIVVEIAIDADRVDCANRRTSRQSHVVAALQRDVAASPSRLHRRGRTNNKVLSSARVSRRDPQTPTIRCRADLINDRHRTVAVDRHVASSKIARRERPAIVVFINIDIDQPSRRRGRIVHRDRIERDTIVRLDL